MPGESSIGHVNQFIIYISSYSKTKRYYDSYLFTVSKGYTSFAKQYQIELQTTSRIDDFKETGI